MRSRNSKTEPGQPSESSNGIGTGPRLVTYRKWTSITDTGTVYCGYALRRASAARQSNSLVFATCIGSTLVGQFYAGLTFEPAWGVEPSALRMRERLQPAVESGVGVDFQVPDLRSGGSHELAQFGCFAAVSSTGRVSRVCCVAGRDTLGHLERECQFPAYSAPRRDCS